MDAIIDISMRELDRAMLKFHDETGFSMERILRKNAGLLQQDLLSTLPPKDRGATEKKITKDVKKVFSPMPPNPFPMKKAESTGTRKLKRTGGDLDGKMHWLYAHPKVLLGVPLTHYKPGSSLWDIYRANHKQATGHTYVDLGTRGNKHVLKLNRYVVGRGEFSRFVRSLVNNVGRLKASFAVAWFRGIAAPAGRKLPRWIARHLENGKAKGSESHNLGRGMHQWITIQSNATGCDGDLARRAIATALTVRRKKLLRDMKNYRRGGVKFGEDYE